MWAGRLLKEIVAAFTITAAFVAFWLGVICFALWLGELIL